MVLWLLTCVVVPLASSKCSDMKMLNGERGRLGFPRLVNSWIAHAHTHTDTDTSQYMTEENTLSKVRHVNNLYKYA